VIVDFVVTVPVPGSLAGQIIFDQSMDTGHLPAVSTFELTVDGTPFAMTPTSWTDSDKLNCSTLASPPSSTGYVRQLVSDPNCYSSLGTFARLQSNVQWFP